MRHSTVRAQPRTAPELTDSVGSGPKMVEYPTVLVTTSLVVTEMVEMIVLVTEPAATLAVAVRVVSWPLMVVVMVVRALGSSLAGTTE